jgi:hypothetical protein
MNVTMKNIAAEMGEMSGFVREIMKLTTHTEDRMTAVE